MSRSSPAMGQRWAYDIASTVTTNIESRGDLMCLLSQLVVATTML